MANLYTTKEFWTPSPKWRWHGLGMLQREMTESTRIHVWHPSLLRVPKGFRRVHDHRFDLTSIVLAGELVDRHYDVDLVVGDEPMGANTHLWSIVHAKAQRGDHDKPSTHPTQPGDDSDVQWIGKAVAKQSAEHLRLAGEIYTLPRGAFHESEPRTLAITMVTRENFHREQQARVLGETAHSAIAGQHRTMEQDDALVADVLRRAQLAIDVLDDAVCKLTRP